MPFLIPPMSPLSSHTSLFSSPGKPGGPLEDQERAALVLSSYKKSLEKSENRLAISRQEVATLQVQLRSVIEGSRRPVSTNYRNNGTTDEVDIAVEKRNLEKQLVSAKNTISSLTEQLEQLTQSKRYVHYKYIHYRRLI